MPCPEYNSRKEDFDSLANDLDYHVRGLHDIAAATFEHIVAHLGLASRLSSETPALGKDRQGMPFHRSRRLLFLYR